MEVSMWGKELMLGEVRYLYVFYFHLTNFLDWGIPLNVISHVLILQFILQSTSMSSSPSSSGISFKQIKFKFKLFGKKIITHETIYIYMYLYIYRVFHNVFTSTLLMTPSVSVASSQSSRPGVIPYVVCFFCYNLSQNNRITNKAHRILNDWQRSHSVHQTYRTRMSLVSSKGELINFDQRSKLVYLPFKCEFKGLPHNYTRYYSVFVDLRHRLNLRV